MSKHYVTFHITGSVTVEVDAPNIREAQDRAWEVFDSAEFGEVEDVDAEVFCIEDGQGERLFEAD